MGLASRRRYRWTRGRVSDYWDEVFTAGRARGARRARRPVRVHRQPRQQPVGADARRARHHPGRPGRHHPRGLARRARRRRRPRHRQDRRRAAPRPPTCCTPTRGSVTAAAACCSSARTGPTWPTSPTCCPASARRACRPARCATSSPRAPRQHAEADPEVARLKSSAEHGGAIEPAVAVLRGAAGHGHGGRRRLGRRAGSAPPTGPRRSRRRTRARRTTRRATQIWEELLTILVDKHGRRRGPADRAAAPIAARRTGSCATAFDRGLAAGRGRPTWSATCGRCPPTCGCARPGSSADEVRRAAARRTPRRGRCPTCRCSTPPGSGSATRRRRGAGAGARPPSRPSASGWPTVVDDLIADRRLRDAA